MEALPEQHKRIPLKFDKQINFLQHVNRNSDSNNSKNNKIRNNYYSRVHQSLYDCVSFVDDTDSCVTLRKAISERLLKLGKCVNINQSFIDKIIAPHQMFENSQYMVSMN